MDNALGRFIRRPPRAGRPRRRSGCPRARAGAPGLRREELALLAGISIDYLVRLEQGRDRHPSAQVAGRRSAACWRSTTRRVAHLHALATDRPARRRPRRRAEQVRPTLQRLVEGMTDQPAFVTGRYLDVLAANPLAAAFEPHVRARPQRGAGDVPVDRGVRHLPGLEKVRADTAAALRASVGTDLDDPRLTELVGELSLKSPEFRRLWARQDVRIKTARRKLYDDPLVGELARLGYDTLEISGSDGQLLVVYSAEPGSRDERALRLLARWCTTIAKTAR